MGTPMAPQQAALRARGAPSVPVPPPAQLKRPLVALKQQVPLVRPPLVPPQLDRLVPALKRLAPPPSPPPPSVKRPAPQPPVPRTLPPPARQPHLDLVHNEPANECPCSCSLFRGAPIQQDEENILDTPSDQLMRLPEHRELDAEPEFEQEHPLPILAHDQLPLAPHQAMAEEREPIFHRDLSVQPEEPSFPSERDEERAHALDADGPNDLEQKLAQQGLVLVPPVVLDDGDEEEASGRPAQQDQHQMGHPEATKIGSGRGGGDVDGKLDDPANSTSNTVTPKPRRRFIKVIRTTRFFRPVARTTPIPSNELRNVQSGTSTAPALDKGDKSAWKTGGESSLGAKAIPKWEDSEVRGGGGSAVPVSEASHASSATTHASELSSSAATVASTSNKSI